MKAGIHGLRINDALTWRKAPGTRSTFWHIIVCDNVNEKQRFSRGVLAVIRDCMQSRRVTAYAAAAAVIDRALDRSYKGASRDAEHRRAAEGNICASLIDPHAAVHMHRSVVSVIVVSVPMQPDHDFDLIAWLVTAAMRAWYVLPALGEGCV
ncbi:hypothetical protein IE81DRAFT_192865 [Ceraceosorus guamensis]|uniref:Uncharacterized protein n=1 Tax=Ceraceosorus guamensis TaxID=1522189 RepID=A0A316W6I3_9BASI|nr:hypothetical protein IE81DRAFT_192865 [Ceraceosorus guamensis]PWN45497.1 hypothetical protein IE81DRAFT_192865 [Ceraceosorus guamensis]